MTFLQTYSGKKFDFQSPDIDAIEIEDIARGLSLQCRFAGQCRRFYSVAEHCIHVSRLLSTEPECMAALLHDAAEAYIGDIPSPLKSLITSIEPIEYRIQKTIYKKFGVYETYSQSAHLIKNADRCALKIEAQNLLNQPFVEDWADKLPDTKLPIAIQCWEPIVAEQLFLSAFYSLELMKGAA